MEKKTQVAAHLTEQELLERIQTSMPSGGAGVLLGIGDDAAVVDAGSGSMVLTVDCLVQGTHFTTDLATAADIGFKAIAVNVSDIAAMAAEPAYCLCALTLPSETEPDWISGFFDGMRQACGVMGVSLVGGNVARGTEISACVTAVGRLAVGEQALTRAGARAGDAIVVSGRLGAAAAGLRRARSSVTLADASPDEGSALARFLRPLPRVAEATALRGAGATALMDISDGLSLDLSRMCSSGSVGAEIDVVALDAVRHPDATFEDALSGGEDYELLAAVPADTAARLSDDFSVIGRFVAGSDIRLRDRDGSFTEMSPSGWDHFADA